MRANKFIVFTLMIFMALNCFAASKKMASDKYSYSIDFPTLFDREFVVCKFELKEKDINSLKKKSGRYAQEFEEFIKLAHEEGTEAAIKAALKEPKYSYTETLCNLLSELDGLEPVYKDDAPDFYADGWMQIYANNSKLTQTYKDDFSRTVYKFYAIRPRDGKFSDEKLLEYFTKNLVVHKGAFESESKSKKERKFLNEKIDERISEYFDNISRVGSNDAIKYIPSYSQVKVPLYYVQLLISYGLKHGYTDYGKKDYRPFDVKESLEFPSSNVEIKIDEESVCNMLSMLLGKEQAFKKVYKMSLNKSGDKEFYYEPMMGGFNSFELEGSRYHPEEQTVTLTCYEEGFPEAERRREKYY